MFSSHGKWSQVQPLLRKSWIISRVSVFPSVNRARICEQSTHLPSAVRSLSTSATPPHTVIWRPLLIAFAEASPAILHSVDFYSTLNSQLRHQLPSKALGFGQVFLLPLPSFRPYIPPSEPLSPTRTESLPLSPALSHTPLHSWHPVMDAQFMTRTCRDKPEKGVRSDGKQQGIWWNLTAVL